MNANILGIDLKVEFDISDKDNESSASDYNDNRDKYNLLVGGSKIWCRCYKETKVNGHFKYKYQGSYPLSHGLNPASVVMLILLWLYTFSKSTNYQKYFSSTRW